MARKQIEENYEKERRVNMSIDLTRRRHDPLKELAGRVLSLSYSDMKRLTRMMTAGTSEDADRFADRLVDVAGFILDGKSR